MDPVLEAAGYIAGTELGGQSMQGCHGQGPGGMAIPTPNLLAIYASEHYVHVIDHHVLKETFSWAGTLGRHGGQWHMSYLSYHSRQVVSALQAIHLAKVCNGPLDAGLQEMCKPSQSPTPDAASLAILPSTAMPDSQTPATGRGFRVDDKKTDRGPWRWHR